MNYLRLHIYLLIALQLSTTLFAQTSKVWIADNGDGTYKNPILHADYSDPDAIRVGDDYYMTGSSFNCVPGLPILHSKDLVNWELVSYALPKLIPTDVFDKPQHGKGIWAPCIRYHNEEYYIYFPDPDFGIYMVKTTDPKGKWSDPVLVKSGKGLIDPTPLWDDDGKVYLAYAFAGSRAGIKSIIVLCTMNEQGTKANEDEVLVFDGHKNHPTIEGPKLYKHNGYYYIFAPAGGVSTGWQLVLRSKNIYGPYEEKIVLEQGKTNINGPHQGAWVKTQTGEDWFIHFQDKGAFGRIVHLQPMKWVNDWPVIGIDKDGDGKGNPVDRFKKPNVGKAHGITTPPDNDEFNVPKLGLQWQWHANPEVYWGFPTGEGHFTLFCKPEPENYVNLFDVPNLLLQKLPSDNFTATTKLTFHANFDGERIGFVIMGLDYSYLSFQQKDGKLFLSQVTCKNADDKSLETESELIPISENTIFLQVEVDENAVCNFSYSENGKKYTKIGKPFTAREGKWIGSKIGFFALRKG
ncbi:MAG: glycoside hydrolase 43 family protein, partial [Bacteroidales bacterium]|nr:glycoside hydrolase 43 family protein [Bacteroidales bacterium]